VLQVLLLELPAKIRIFSFRHFFLAEEVNPLVVALPEHMAAVAVLAGTVVLVAAEVR
jgi:hypothetical protein